MSIPAYDPSAWQSVADLIADAGLKPPAPVRTPHDSGFKCWCKPPVVSIGHAMGLWHIGTAHQYGKWRGDIMRVFATAVQM